MIQSDIFDSSNMNIKKIVNTALLFTVKRLIEILGFVVLLLGILLLISLISYSPNDPNFIFSDTIEIKNLLGFRGSFVSDLFFQSIGLISYLVSITLIITGVNIFKTKDLFLIIENFFYVVLYSILGSLFLNFFYEDAFSLYINGNGGFVGNYLSKTFLEDLILLNKEISFYFLIILIVCLFFISINFSIKKFYSFLMKIINFIRKKNNKNYTDKTEIINEYIPQDEIKNLIQEDLPFIKAGSIKDLNKTKFMLPTIDLLKIPSKNEKVVSKKNEQQDTKFLEKILLDFCVD